MDVLTSNARTARLKGPFTGRPPSPGFIRNGIRSRGSDRVLPQAGFVLAPAKSGQEATTGAFWEAKPPQGNDPSAGQCDAFTDIVPSQVKRKGAGKDQNVLSRCLRPTSPLYTPLSHALHRTTRSRGQNAA